MRYTQLTDKPLGKGRPAISLFALLRKEITGGRLPGGTFLPTVRQLCKAYGIGPNTVLRAIRMLQGEGLVASEPRRGYRVLASANDPRRGCPLAFVLARESVADGYEPLYRRLAALLGRRVRRHGSSLITMLSDQTDEESLVNKMREMKAWGLVIDSAQCGVVERARALGMPVVAIDVWSPSGQLDVVVQDDFAGGWQAAEHLVRSGHRRIGWLGPDVLSDHSRARYGGAAALLAEQGLAFCRESRLGSGTETPIETAATMLASADRPSAVLALWKPAATALVAACRQLRLELGSDVEMVGWCPEELYAETFSPIFSGGPVGSAVVWSMAAMADAVIARLNERRANPGMAPARIHVPTRLRPAE